MPLPSPRSKARRSHSAIPFTAIVVVLVAVGIGAIGLLRAETSSQSLAAYCASLREKFPDVPTITPDELARMDSSPLLLDVRDENEYAVSHLSGAVRVEKDFAVQLSRIGITKERPIVVYCSVGYRSAVLARALQKEGFTNVRNLEGSIFAWANEGRPLVNSNGATSGAHPFNPLWGRYLEKSRWRWKPENPITP